MDKSNQKGTYQIRRIVSDIREKQAKDDAEVVINSALNELQLDSNIEVIDVTEIVVDKNWMHILIKYWDYGLNN